MKFFLIILFTLLTHNSFGAIKILIIKGTVKYRLPKVRDWKEAEKGMTLLEGTHIKTYSKSIVRIKHGDTTMNVSPKTIITLGPETLTKKKPNSIRLLKGFLWAKTNKKDKKKNNTFNVKTKSAVMGVRGTQFAVSHSKHDGSLTCVCEGSVEITQKEKSNIISRGAGLETYKDKGQTTKNYMSLMKKGVPKKSFYKLVKKDHRYKNCLYCHKKDFSLSKFEFPNHGYSDFTNFDYD
jgi:hypothetical protein